jgi:phosphoribosyl-AMP cyclohydrolase
MRPLPVKFDEKGLVAVVIQDDQSGAVLMLAFMNDEALRLTRATKRTHFWSRSRQMLWKKGETSGHEQVVKSIHVNCYEDSLLIRVDQIGAACHTGFPTCYYRELGPDNALVETEPRAFDPELVYGQQLRPRIEQWIGAYQWLADRDLATESKTSRLLRVGESGDLAKRVADELGELAGVIDGTHAHGDPIGDLLLEGSQVLYWCVLFGLRSGVSAQRLAELTESPAGQPRTAQPNLTAEIRDGTARWHSPANWSPEDLISGAICLVTAAAVSAGTSLEAVIGRDLADLRTKPYLEEYFED